jgi:hypothetical protein
MKLLGLGSDTPYGKVVAIARDGVTFEGGIVLPLEVVEKFFA